MEKITICFNCHKEYKIKNYLKNKTKFCSRKCKDSYYSGVGSRPNSKTGKIIKCYTCGKEIYKQKCLIKERNYCSIECLQISPYKRIVSSKRLKENNPSHNKTLRKIMTKKQKEYWKNNKPHNYIDGSSRNRKYTRSDWIKISKEIYKRDKFKCQKCGKKGGLLNVHHIKPWAGNEKLRFNFNNLITLCVSCHSSIHKQKQWCET